MSFLYRHALFVSRKRPYLDWAKGSDPDAPDLTQELSRHGRTVYLVPEADVEPELNKLVAQFWEEIFQNELTAWIIAADHWPQARSREMFDEWFDVELNSCVYDLTPDEPLTQTEVDAANLDEALGFCASCGLEVDEGAGRFAEFALADRSLFASYEGRVIPLNCGEDTVVLALMTGRDSEPARGGIDLLVRVCSSRCEKDVRKLVPKALRRLRPIGELSR